MQPQLEILSKVLLAMRLGAAIGMEREEANKPAGLRTHMLVTGAAALFMLLGEVLLDHYMPLGAGEVIRSDPIRLIEAVVTGISFLGAGTIFRIKEHQTTVEGLTTAASILFAAGLGVAVVLSQFLLAVGLTVIVLVTLRGLGILQRQGRAQLRTAATSGRARRSTSRTCTASIAIFFNSLS